jgi:hypothetical protein
MTKGKIVKIKIITNTLVALALIPLCANAKENTFSIDITSPAQIQDFMRKNAGLMYVKDSERLLQTRLGGAYSRGANYMDSYIKKFYNGKAICRASFLVADGDFIKPDEIEKITVKKDYKSEGFRRLRGDYLVYIIKISGKGWFQSRTVKIYVNYFSKLQNKPVECELPNSSGSSWYYNPGKKITIPDFNYPSSLYIPKEALANIDNQKRISDEIKKNLAQNLGDNNTTGGRITELKRQLAAGMPI